MICKYSRSLVHCKEADIRSSLLSMLLVEDIPIVKEIWSKCSNPNMKATFKDSALLYVVNWHT